MAKNFEINNTYSFQTLAPAILGGRFVRAVYSGKLSYQHAAMMQPNLLERYRRIYPSLPTGTADAAKSCSYHIFTTQAGDTSVLCEQWIDFESVEVIEGIDAVVRLQGLSTQDPQHIRNLLNEAGYTGQFTIEVTSK